MSVGAADLYSGVEHARLYSKYRPLLPQPCVEHIISYLKEKLNPPFGKAVDIGCGSGQSTQGLSPYFEAVLGLDASEAQITNAKEFHCAANIEYKQSYCGKLPVETSSVHLVTFCQSFHWFNIDEILAEVERVLVPNGVIAVCGHWILLPRLNNEYKDNKISKLIIEEFYMGKFRNDSIHKGLSFIDELYKSIILPFKDSHRMTFESYTESTLADYMGYISTWSGYQQIKKKDCKKAEQLLLEIQNKLIAILEEDKAPEDINFTVFCDYFIIIGHK